MIKKILKFIFKNEYNEMNANLRVLKSELARSMAVIDYLESQKKAFDSVLSNIDVSVDAYESKYSRSWAVVSLQGGKSDFIKFIDLGQSDIIEISRFLRRYEQFDCNCKVDANPSASDFLRIRRKQFNI